MAAQYSLAGSNTAYSLAPPPAALLPPADIDLNTWHVLRAVLGAGYRPRAIAAEFNRRVRA
jgi:hypothetical protein